MTAGKAGEGIRTCVRNRQACTRWNGSFCDLSTIWMSGVVRKGVWLQVRKRDSFQTITANSEHAGGIEYHKRASRVDKSCQKSMQIAVLV